VVVTRAPEQAVDLITRLQKLGAEVLLLPAVSFADPKDTAPLDRAIRALGVTDWVLLTSQNAARFFAKRCRALGALQGNNGWAATRVSPQVAVVGPATAEAARKEGFSVAHVASQFRGTALAQELGAQLAGKRVLLPRSDRASAGLPAALRAVGAEVVNVVAYRTATPEAFDPGVLDLIRRGEVDVIALLSPSALHHLVDELGLEALRRVAGSVAFAAIGPVTSSAIREAGLPVEMEAPEATSASLVTVIARYFAQRFPSGVKTP
jgi:uroporphyrinogen-III synthase